MGKIINFPKSRRNLHNYSSPSRELFATIKDLVWSDPDAYFSLEASCLLDTVLPMDFKIREKLSSLKLLDENDLPWPDVVNIIDSVTRASEMRG